MIADQGGEKDLSTEPSDAGLTGVASLDVKDEKNEIVDVPNAEAPSDLIPQSEERVQNVQVVSGNHDHKKTQYRLTVQLKKRKSLLDHLPFRRDVPPSIEDSDSNLNFSNGLSRGLNAYIVSTLKWTFKTSILSLITASIITYLCFTAVFALLIFFSSTISPECISPRIHSTLNSTAFRDSWTLSWTTFSTVGYGLIAPTTSASFEEDLAKFEDHDHCFGISFLCSLEAFFGILFAGFCGAIIFAKITRIHSQAQVMFSSSMVVRHGRSLNINDSSEDVYYFCPVLEFRIINRLWGFMGGEIMDASVNVVASLNSIYVDKDVVTAMNSNIKNKLNKAVKKQWANNTLQKILNSKKDQSIQNQNSPRDVDASLKIHLDSDTLGFEQGETEGVHTHTEDASNIVPALIYTKLDVKPDKHPFFRRVWLVRHVLDQNSPLLKKSIRRSIKENNGQWPKEINTDEAVKDSFKFHQILVSFSGTSNASASDVYAQKIYDFKNKDCTLVGHTFENVLNRKADLRLSVDLKKVHKTKACGTNECM